MYACNYPLYILGRYICVCMYMYVHVRMYMCMYIPMCVHMCVPDMNIAAVYWVIFMTINCI